MKLPFAIQHRTSKRYLAVNPSVESVGSHEVVAAINAARYEDWDSARTAWKALGEFKGAYVVVNLEAQLARAPRPTLDGDNASVFDRAQAWTAVEAAQEMLNAAARLRETPEALAYDRAMDAWTDGAALVGSIESAAGWERVRDCQLALNVSVNGLPQFADENAALHLALSTYIKIGGASSRAPGCGGLS